MTREEAIEVKSKALHRLFEEAVYELFGSETIDAKDMNGLGMEARRANRLKRGDAALSGILAALSLPVASPVAAVCPVCRGSGSVKRPSFSVPGEAVLSSCSICHGSGKLNGAAAASPQGGVGKAKEEFYDAIDALMAGEEETLYARSDDALVSSTLMKWSLSDEAAAKWRAWKNLESL